MIDIALFGLGRIGIMHGKNLMRNKDFNLKYVYDIDKNLTKKYSKILKAESVDNPNIICLLYTSPSPRDLSTSRMPSSA